MLINAVLDFGPMFAEPTLAQVDLATRWLGYFWVGLQVAAGLGFVIFVHELGHFLAAKTFGVKCEKFYVGFDVPISIGPIRLPRTLGRFTWGETEYGIGIVPLGGYVKMLGQDDDPRKAEEEAARSRLGDGEGASLDPRSYQAKPVWQRMIIISAGVVMNVIFAVFLAAGAFLYGVPYTPTVLGNLPLGSPAWQSSLKPGDKVVQMARMTRDDPNLRFEDLVGKTVVHGMKYKETAIPFTVERDGKRVTVSLVPSSKLSPDGSLYLVGIGSAAKSTLSDVKPVAPFSYLASKKVDLQPGDRVVAVDGQPLPVHAATDAILGTTLIDQFHAKWNKPIELTIERSEKSESGKAAAATREVKVTLPPVPAKSLGVGFGIGPITAIQSASLAEKAGLKPGDIIEAVDGQAVVDAMRLPMQVAEKLGQEIAFKIRRPRASGASVLKEPFSDTSSQTTDQTPSETASEITNEIATETAIPGSSGAESSADGNGADEETFTVRMTSEGPVAFGTIGGVSGQFGLANYGVAYSVSPKVAFVDADNPKATADVEIGDELTQLKIEPTEAELKELESPALAARPLVVSPRETVPTYFSMLQQWPEGMKVRCFFKRGAETREVLLTLENEKDWYWMQRGILQAPLEKIQRTNQLGEALAWGVGETGRRLNDVFEFLTVLVSGRASPRHLAGPFGIAEVAANEASSSPSRLLLFLTLLSANLAILNFLPIPALDGGHMMFLIAEAIRGKPLNEALQIRLTMVGVMCLLGLMAFAILNDILRKIM